MALVGFPETFTVVIGDVLGLNASYIAADEEITLQKVTGSNIWTEDGTMSADSTSNRLKFTPQDTPWSSTGIFSLLLFTAVEIDGVWGLSSWIEDFWWHPAWGALNTAQNTADYTFQSVWNNTSAIFGIWALRSFYWATGGNYQPDCFKSFGASVSLTQVDMSLRYATEISEGIGWSVMENDDWVSPASDWATFPIIDDNGVTRALVLDNDDYIYELDTYDRINNIYPPALDKEDIEDSEIFWEKHQLTHKSQEGSEHFKIEHDECHIYTEPFYPEFRGQDDYSSSGYRDAQELSIEEYLDGEKREPIALTDDIPQNGDIVYSGTKSEARQIQHVLKGDAGEIRITGIVHDYIFKTKAGSISERTMQEHTIQTRLETNKIIHVTRDWKPLRNRVDGDVYTATYNYAQGPDGRENSAFELTSDLTLDNEALTNHTIVLFTQTAAPGPIAGVTMTEYNNNGTWYCLYSIGAGPVALNRVVANGTYIFDLRFYNAQITDFVADILPYLYRDVIQNSGNGLLPGF